MKFRSTIFLFIVICSVSGCLAQLPPKNQDYKMVFNDEFDKPYKNDEPLDPKKWARIPPYNQSTNVLDASWCYPKDTAKRYYDRAYDIGNPKDTTTLYVSNGTCKILTNKVSYIGQVWNWPECDPQRPGFAKDGNKCKESCKLNVNGKDSIWRCWTAEDLPFKYTTSMLFSQQKFFRGYFEIRFRLPPTPEAPYTHQGFGPNFWLYGKNLPVNWSSEIDVFEMISFNPQQGDTNKYTSTVYYTDTPTKRPGLHTEVIGNKLKDDTNWHTAAAWWTNDFVKFYLDDSLFFTVQNDKEILVDKLAPMQIIIGIAAPLAGRCNDFDPVYTKFPYVYELDYVRVYQEK